MMHITIEDIARISGVSKSSVSRYLNNGSVSKKSAEKIKEAIEKTGFETNVFASRLKSKKSHLIGVLMKGIESVSVTKTITGINRYLKQYDYLPFVIYDDVDEDNDLNKMKALVAQGVDAIIYGNSHCSNEIRQFISSIKIPVVMVGQKDSVFPYRKFDDYQAGRILGEYIKSCGMRNIVYLGVNEEDESVGVDRKQGIIDVFKTCTSYDFHYVEADFSFDASYQKAKECLAYHPDIIIGASDRMSMGALLYLHEQKISVPEQISVAGFGGYDFSKVTCPPLTTIAYDYYQLGRLAAQDVLKILNEECNEALNEPEMKLIIRESVKTLKSE